MKFLGTFDWQKFDAMRQGAYHASHVASQASTNAQRVGTKAAHDEAAKHHATAANLHQAAHDYAVSQGYHNIKSVGTMHNTSALNHRAEASRHSSFDANAPKKQGVFSKLFHKG